MTPEELIAEIEKAVRAEMTPLRTLIGWAAGASVGTCALLCVLIVWIS